MSHKIDVVRLRKLASELSAELCRLAWAYREHFGTLSTIDIFVMNAVGCVELDPDPEPRRRSVEVCDSSLTTSVRILEELETRRGIKTGTAKDKVMEMSGIVRGII